jgi:hypothetical protein
MWQREGNMTEEVNTFGILSSYSSVAHWFFRLPTLSLPLSSWSTSVSPKSSLSFSAPCWHSPGQGLTVEVADDFDQKILVLVFWRGRIQAEHVEAPRVGKKGRILFLDIFMSSLTWSWGGNSCHSQSPVVFGGVRGREGESGRTCAYTYVNSWVP